MGSGHANGWLARKLPAGASTQLDGDQVRIRTDHAPSRHGTHGMRLIWSLLFMLFAAYTVLVYVAGDPSPPDPITASATRGRATWHALNCQACHQLYGLGGYMGPDLTNVHSAKGAARIRTFVRFGTGRMPAHALSETELDDLVGFLEWVDKSGLSRVPADAVHWTGTYMIEPR